MGVPPSTPPLEKNIAGRNMNTRITDRKILAFSILFFLNAYITYIVKKMAPIMVEIVAEKGSCIIRPHGIAANSATRTEIESIINVLSSIFIEESYT